MLLQIDDFIIMTVDSADTAEPGEDTSRIKKDNALADICDHLEQRLPLTSREIFSEFALLSGHPWQETAQSELTTYYACLYGLAFNEKPRKILEIGTAFGLSAATLLKACSTVELFISVDLGIYGYQLGFMNNIDFARSCIYSWCSKKGIPLERVRFYQANTQPPGRGDNDGMGKEILRWYQIPDLVRLLQACEFDVIFIDGKHTEDGLLNDLNNFFPFLKPGGLIICDDLHDPLVYKNIYPWAQDIFHSFFLFLKTHSSLISDFFIWNFPQVSPGGKIGLRPFGIIRKKSSEQLSAAGGFEVFDYKEAMEINRARLDHLASLGLELAGKSVLEVGAGVGWLTGFFERLGCSVLSTDARVENVKEHLIRYPKRRVKLADLTVPGSHTKFGEFDIVFCYGTLYHLSNPSLCIKELSKICREIFILETCVDPQDVGGVNFVRENVSTLNQSYNGIGCRPSRNWVFSELKKFFPYVYTTVAQPNHPEFPVSWPAYLPQNVQNARAVFVASKHQLNLPTLLDNLPKTQYRLAELII